MILNKICKLSISFSIILLINSCGSIKEYVGLTDEDVERELINSTPELVLPPDFGKRATKSRIPSNKSDFGEQSQLALMPSPQTVQPRVSNFVAPNFYSPSSKTPSESLEKFKQPFGQLSDEQKDAHTNAIWRGEVVNWQGPPPPLFYMMVRSDAVDVVYGTKEGFDKLNVPYMAHIMPEEKW